MDGECAKEMGGGANAPAPARETATALGVLDSQGSVHPRPGRIVRAVRHELHALAG